MSSILSQDRFVLRHIGPDAAETQLMLERIGMDSMETLIKQTVPASIRRQGALNLPKAQTEFDYLRQLKTVAQKNKTFRSYIGMGYYGTITPSVILRNIFENPGWYTQYTPYQAEIAQGRLEALLNFQTMVSDLTAMPIANASLLDEGTAAAEAMSMFFAIKNKRNKGEAINTLFVDEGVLPQTVDILRTRAKFLGIELEVGKWNEFEAHDKTFGVLLQYPSQVGAVEDYTAFAKKVKEAGAYVIVAADLLALTLLKPPGEWGADAVVGTSQRFGIPMGYGGPHAAYFATLDEYKRLIPGRIIGLSEDSHGNPALRMALQTREQHIRRDKATSNICTAQALLAIMSGMYAAYHGPDGLKAIATRINHLGQLLSNELSKMGFKNQNKYYFDTLLIDCLDYSTREEIYSLALEHEINLQKSGTVALSISLDETVSISDIDELITLFAVYNESKQRGNIQRLNEAQYLVEAKPLTYSIPNTIIRTSDYLTHPVFNTHRTETEMMRYIKRLENKDLSLVHSMIALGSCTMKLNAATQLIPVSWAEFAHIHPFAPIDQVQGYKQIISELADYLCEITGFTACSFQPNSGAQGEFTGLLTIAAYHEANGELHRNVAIIPSSAHGTNPASAVMAGMKVVVTKCDEKGNIDLVDLKDKVELHKDNLACLMVTYPSTHGVFEEDIIAICALIHEHGGKVYMDGANMNAQVGLTSPALIGADVCHLNLHKTFSIPHGGGGPGMGPICVNDSLKPYLPGHTLVDMEGGADSSTAVSSAPWGSASILLISYAYIKMLGQEGVTEATKYAILNANYIRTRLQEAYPVLYLGKNGCSAHELIIDLRQFKALNVSAEDVAKRLIDYGFHAPTLSFPVAGTMMIEPTESESLDEIDRFCEAMLAIRKEIDEIATGEADANINVLVNAPHTQELITADDWNLPYSRSKAAYPLPYLKQGYKFWATIGRINNAKGDRNLICTCPPIEMYETI